MEGGGGSTMTRHWCAGPRTPSDSGVRPGRLGAGASRRIRGLRSRPAIARFSRVGAAANYKWPDSSLCGLLLRHHFRLSSSCAVF